ncbi:carbohydrate porin [Gluconobacter wancherniae]|uniref:carbohydrate porin n=1 Tax=Gluconobacter wancherniae TaxID=1307955 RepID=UPI00309F7C2B
MQQVSSEWLKVLGMACAISSVFPLGLSGAYAETTKKSAAKHHSSAQPPHQTGNIAANHPHTMGSPVIRNTGRQPTFPAIQSAGPVPAQDSGAISDSTQHSFFPASFHDWLTQSTMTGDWGGYRTRLTNMGINIGGHYLEDSAGNPMGGKSKNVRYADEFGINVDFNLKKLTGWNLGMIHTLITARQGLGLGATLPALDSPQQIFGSGETVRLTRLSWEMPWNHYVSTEVGEINTENDFEQSSMYWGMSEYCQFESNAICGMPQSIAMNSGYGYYPTAHPGAWVKFYPAGNNHYLVQFGAYSVDPVISNTHNGWKMNLHGATGTYVPFQLGWHRGGNDDFSGPLQTNIKIGGYWDSSQVSDVYSKLASYGVPSQYLISAPTAKVRGRFGGWFQFDHMLERDASDPSRGTSFFGSFTWGDPRTAVAPYFITWGLTRKGTFANRPNDTISLGMKMLWVNPKLTIWARQMQAAGADFNKPSGESAMELNYGWRPTPWLVIRPGAQYIWNTGGTHRYKNPLLLDFETGITF